MTTTPNPTALRSHAYLGFEPGPKRPLAMVRARGRRPGP